MNTVINPQTESQNAMILAHLESGNTITGMDALNLFDCWSLPQRIKNLRDYGWNIHKTMEKEGRKRYARYYLPKGGNNE